VNPAKILLVLIKHIIRDQFFELNQRCPDSAICHSQIVEMDGIVTCDTTIQVNLDRTQFFLEYCLGNLG
jgi:hypothetical protein